MRAGSHRLFILLGLTAPLWMSQTGCSKEVRAEFPRPPATASMPAPSEAEPDASELPAPVEAEAVPAPDPATAPAPSPEPEAEAMAKPPPTPTRPRPAKLPEPTEPEPDPPSPQLAGGNGGEPDPALLTKLRRASSLLTSVGRRELSAPQEEQFQAARGFVAQARMALIDGDERRALVLIDKGLILAEDVERTSRP